MNPNKIQTETVPAVLPVGPQRSSGLAIDGVKGSAHSPPASPLRPAIPTPTFPFQKAGFWRYTPNYGTQFAHVHGRSGAGRGRRLHRYGARAAIELVIEERLARGESIPSDVEPQIERITLAA
jgi:hypothetical protein